jgi:ribonuclease D
MNIDIKLHKNDLPDDIKLGNVIAVDGEFMGLDVRRDPLCLIQISSGNSDAHIIQLDRSEYNAPNLVNILARSYSDSHSLKTLIKEFINVDISKQFQSSDFGGELTPAQLKYCANDVVYLHKIHDELIKILDRENRIELYKNCLKFLKTRVDLDLALFKDDIWSH